MILFFIYLKIYIFKQYSLNKMDSANIMSDNLIVIFLLLELVFVLTIALVLFIRKAKKNKKEDDEFLNHNKD